MFAGSIGLLIDAALRYSRAQINFTIRMALQKGQTYRDRHVREFRFEDDESSCRIVVVCDALEALSQRSSVMT